MLPLSQTHCSILTTKLFLDRMSESSWSITPSERILTRCVLRSKKLYQKRFEPILVKPLYTSANAAFVTDLLLYTVLFAAPHRFLVSACTVVIKWERHKMSTRTSFVKIWTVSNCEFNANFLTFLSLYHLFFALETIGVSEITIWWLIFEKKPFQFWREIWIWVVVILLQLYYLFLRRNVNKRKVEYQVFVTLSLFQRQQLYLTEVQVFSLGLPIKRKTCWNSIRK